MTLFIKSLGEGMPLVFLHGWGFDHSIWLDIAEKIKGHYAIYLVDLPGFGESSLMDWEPFKSGLINALPTKFAVVGWSLGGLFATRLACEEPQRVTHLMNVASTPFFIKEGDWPGIQKTVLDTFFAKLEEDPQKTTEQFIALQLHDSYLQIIQSPHITHEGLEQGLSILASWDLREAIHSLDVPTSYLFGRLDAIVPRKTLKIMQATYSRLDYVLFDKSAHIPFLSEPEKFVNLLGRFLI